MTMLFAHAFVPIEGQPPIRLVGRSIYQCPWPVGTPDERHLQLCCGAEKFATQNYCAVHATVSAGKRYAPRKISWTYKGARAL